MNGVIITIKKRDYRVGPSQHGGLFIVERFKSGSEAPVRNPRERDAVAAAYAAVIARQS